VQLTDDEIAELNNAITRDRERSEELRARLVQRPVVAGTAEFVAGTLDRYADADPPETELVRAAKAGNPRAREELIERYLPLVVATARSFHAEGLDFTDLVQEGVTGLLRALERFDPDRGAPFAAYAKPWIRYSLQELRRDFMRPMRLSRQALRELSQLKSEYGRLHAVKGHEPSLTEAAARLGIDRDRAEELIRANALPRSLYDEVAVDEAPLAGREIARLSELVEDPVSTDAYEEVLDRVAGAQLRVLLTRLTEREHEILVARFGLDGRPPERLSEIAERLGVSVAQVRRLEQRALAKLRQAARSSQPAV
jgi:RNA polymerase sigma factor (sigma-70 family)